MKSNRTCKGLFRGNGGMYMKERKIECSINLATSLLVAILNIAEIIFITKIKRRKKIYEIIIASLSVSDCLFGLSNAIICSIFLSKSWKQEDDLLETVYFAYVFFVFASIFHLVFIAVDRVMIVLIPFQYETIFTRKRLKIGIALLWILAFGISISTYVYYELRTSDSKPNDSNIRNSTLGSIMHKREKLCRKRFMKQSLQKHMKQNFAKGVKQSFQKTMKESLQKDMQLILSISIVASDILMILCYSTILYQINCKTRKCETAKGKKEEGLPLLCVFIAGVFVMFTLPFAITRLNLRYVPFWADYSMILNSGMNSVVYFFRGRLENYQTKDS